MTINTNGLQLASYQSFSYSSISVTAFQSATRTQQAVTPTTPATPTASAKDSVSLSRQALSQSAARTSETPSPTEKPAPLPSVPTPTAAPASTSSVGSKAEALFKALDANQDGSVTEDEFKAGARALLRRGREHHAEGAHHGERGHHGGKRLDRSLGRVFDRVDANGDGTLTKDELASALAATSRTSEPATPEAPKPSSATSASGTFVNITVVSVAIRTYTLAGQSQAQAITDAAASSAAKPEAAAKVDGPSTSTALTSEAPKATPGGLPQ